MKDVIVQVSIGARASTTDTLSILILSTSGTKAIETYTSLTDIKTDFPDTTVNNVVTPSKIYSKAAALFNQSATTLAGKTISKVKIGGVAELTGEDDEDKAADLVTKLEALRLTDDDWYILLTDKDGDDYVNALCEWVEENGESTVRKMYFGQTQTKAFAGTRRRAVVMYTDDLTEEADAAYLGNVGPFYPESVSWKFKRPAGLDVPSLTDSERDALETANVNFMTSEYKKEYVKNGVCTDGEYIDVQLGCDYIVQRMRSALYDVFLRNAKVPYTDSGFALVAGAVFDALNNATNLHIVARDPASNAGLFTVNVPRRSDATEEQASSRTMPPIDWSAEIEGAVHNVRVSGTLVTTLSA